MASSSKDFVLDFSGRLILRKTARKIQGQFYQEGVSCINMEDGLWYRTNTNKIVYDHFFKRWVFTKNAGNLIKGIVDGDKSFGSFSPSVHNVNLVYPQETVTCLNEQVAKAAGFVEAIFDGRFYQKDVYDVNASTYGRPNVPAGMRTNTYNLDDEPNIKAQLINSYNSNPIKPGVLSRAIANKIPYSFGLELETSNGFIPPRLATPLGVRPLRDGSVDGIEYTTIPMTGPKGIEAIKSICDELIKRTEIDLKCSLHVHFGNVRRDKLYIVSLWYLLLVIQDELFKYFPYSRSNSIDGARKVYCKKLPGIGINPQEILKAKTKDSFHEALNQEFNKIYMFLNGKLPGDIIKAELVKVPRKGDKWSIAEKTVVYTTKTATHSIAGPKWNREMRYHAVNLLPTFFSESRTIEFRIHEATVNFNKVAMWMLLCSSILKVAEDFDFVFGSEYDLAKVLEKANGTLFSSKMMGYLNERKSTFMKGNQFLENWQNVEKKWLKDDKKFSYDLSWLSKL